MGTLVAVKFLGIVRDGARQAGGFTQLNWVRDQIRAKFNFDPYPGTLNLQIENPGALDAWHTRAGIAIDPAPGYCPARCFRVQLNGKIFAVWLIPDVPNYSRDVIELIAPVCLRDALGVQTGDAVEIEIRD
jgi:CTP-dependent riboflavin kinase